MLTAMHRDGIDDNPCQRRLAKELGERRQLQPLVGGVLCREVDQR
jgi:hypothetical protein